MNQRFLVNAVVIVEGNETVTEHEVAYWFARLCATTSKSGKITGWKSLEVHTVKEEKP